MTWEEYKEEIELIEKQNNVEYDLYNVIYAVLREREKFKLISIRNVSDRVRTKSKKEELLWGIKGFPDFILLDKEYNPEDKKKEKILGAVEAKYVGKPILNDKEDITQLIGHILWFGKVIYTNGVEWRIYNGGWDELKQRDINKLQRKTYSIHGSKNEITKKWERVDQYLLLNFSLNDLKFQSFILRKIDDDNNIEWNYSEWERLLNHLDNFEIYKINEC